MTPNELINKSVSNLYEKHIDCISIINNKLKQSNYLGGKLKIKLDCAIDSKCFNDLIFIYRYEGWKQVEFINKVDGKNKLVTIIIFNYF